MDNSEMQESQKNTSNRNKTPNVVERVSNTWQKTKAETQLNAMANAVSHQLQFSPEKIRFTAISTTEGMWMTTKHIKGGVLSIMTEATDEPNAEREARRLTFRISKKGIKDGQVAILFLPNEFECTDAAAATKINKRVESQRGEKDYSNEMEAALGEAKDMYKPEQWKPSEMEAIVFMRIKDNLYNVSVVLENESEKGKKAPFITPVSRHKFVGNKAIIGQHIYLTADEEREYKRFYKKYGKILITKKATRKEIKGS